VALEQTKGAQLVVLMVGSTGAEPIEQYSLAVAEANKVGRKGTDDGVLLLIAKHDRAVRIEVGYGLEGAIPDAANARIIREYIAPKFRTGDYYGGIRDAVGALRQLINGEPLPPPVRGAPHEQHGPGLQGVFIIALFAAIFLRGVLGRTHALVRAAVGGAIIGGLLWLLVSAGIGLLGAVIGGVFMLLPGGAVLGGLDAAGRARQVFSQLRVWNTEHNSGVLLYVLLAEHRIEIVVDRGIAARVAPGEWDAICARMRDSYTRGQWREGSLAGIAAAHAVLLKHFPGNDKADPDELPDRPVLL